MSGQDNQVIAAPMTIWLRFKLESDATFGRGDGIPGLIDRNVAVDEYGCPYLHGRTLKGLLNESCIDLLYALGSRAAEWFGVADTLFGYAGSDLAAEGLMRVNHAQLPEALHRAIRSEQAPNRWTPDDVTASLTTIRYQTALGTNGEPEPRTLRATRVILRETHFEAQLHFARTLSESEQVLLGATVKGLRRAGLMRNRGRGRILAMLETEGGQNLSDKWFSLFQQRITSSTHDLDESATSQTEMNEELTQ